MPTSAEPGNFELIAQQFLQALRGKRSQRAFAKRLGYKANPITDWEHGRRYPTAQEALRAAALVGVDVSKAFRAFHPAALEGAPGRFALAAWLSALRGSTSIVGVSERAGVSRFAARRWLGGNAQPRLPDFFRLVEAITGRLHDLVAALVPIELVPTLHARHASVMALRGAAYSAPWSEAVLRVIETVAYRALPRHEPGFIARQLGIAVEEERAALAVLVKAGSLKRRRGLYIYRDDETVDTRGDVDRVTHLLQHWNTAAHARIPHRRSRDLFAYNVFAVSEVDLDAAREVLRRAFREVRTIAARSKPVEQVAILNLQLITF